MTDRRQSAAARPGLGRRHVLGLAGGAVILGFGGIRLAWSQGPAPSITVYKSPT
jgi:hypothetical protein